MPRRKSAAHKIALALVWLTVALSCFVFVEPAPVDVMTCGLFLLLPLVGLVAYKEKAAALFAVLLAISALQFLGANFAYDTQIALTHNTISLYLFGASFLFASFIAKRPAAHTRLILNAYLVSAVIAACSGIAGYLDLFPGAYELLTRYDRATGPFKDPNVFGPFLVPALVTSLHMWLTQPLRRGVLPLLVAAVLSGGLLLSFSRGAWGAAALAAAIYMYFYLLAAQRNVERVKLAALVLLVTIVLALVLTAALQIPSVADLIEQRATLTQPYDEGPEGRFGGQEKALDLILENPLGLGGQQFAPFVHHEEPHNVYLTLFLSAGWTGGVLYLFLCATLLTAGFQHALRATRTRGLFVIAYASLAAIIFLGAIIDADHWRHSYLLIGIVTGLMASDTRTVRLGRILSDRRPILMRKVLVIAPMRRNGRMLRKLPPALGSNLSLALATPDATPRPRRPPRLR